MVGVDTSEGEDTINSPGLGDTTGGSDKTKGGEAN